MTFPDYYYESAKENHMDHTEENPDPNCYFCRRNDWAEKPEKKQTQEYTTGMLKKMRNDYSILQKKIKHLELELKREIELRRKFNKLDDKLSEHDDQYQDYQREEGQYEVKELEKQRHEEKRKELMQ